MRKEAFRMFAIICIIIAVVIVNAGYQLLMNVLGANAMFFSVKTKLVLYLIVATLIYSSFGG